MTAPNRDLSAPELWQRSLERSRRRRVTAPQLRRQAARRRRASSAMAAAMIAGPAAQIAAAQPSAGGAPQPNLASESPANRAIGGVENRAAQVELKLGSEGEAVAAVQRKLGVDPADGNFGESTDRAVRVFQGNEGLAVDGIVGPQTWGALFGGGLNPAAAPGGSGLKVTPVARDHDRAPVGDRTQFAVRMASDDELDSDERAQLNAHRAPAKTKDGEGALVAIEFRAPEGSEEEPPSGNRSLSRSEESGDRGERSVADPPQSESTPRDGGGERGEPREQSESESRAQDASREPEEASRPKEEGKSEKESKPEEASKPKEASNPKEASKPKPQATKPKPQSKPRKDSGSASNCGSRKLTDPLGGKGTFTSGFRTASRPSHSGLDLAAPSGTPIRAATCGVVNLLQGTSQSGGYGNFICVKRSSSFTTCYAHLSRFSDERMGSRVRAGEVIGYVGSTGNSTGPHLHFETRTGAPYGGTAMDPTPYLRGREFGGTGGGAIGGPDLEQSTPEQESVGASLVSAGSAEDARSGTSGATSATDGDADGVTDISDNCPSV